MDTFSGFQGFTLAFQYVSSKRVLREARCCLVCNKLSKHPISVNQFQNKRRHGCWSFKYCLFYVSFSQYPTESLADYSVPCSLIASRFTEKGLNGFWILILVSLIIKLSLSREPAECCQWLAYVCYCLNYHGLCCWLTDLDSWDWSEATHEWFQASIQHSTESSSHLKLYLP